MLSSLKTGLWGSGMGRADSPASAMLSFIVVFAFLVKVFGVGPLPLLAGVGAAAGAYVRPRIGIVIVITAVLVAATAAHWWLLLLGAPVALGYFLIWRKEEGWTPLLPFTAPLLANVLAPIGLGLGLFGLPILSILIRPPMPYVDQTGKAHHD